MDLPIITVASLPIVCFIILLIMCLPIIIISIIFLPKKSKSLKNNSKHGVCEHEYALCRITFEWYSNDARGCWQPEFYFICKKCNNEKIIEWPQIYDALERYKREEEKDTALKHNKNIPVSLLKMPNDWCKYKGGYKIYEGIYVTQAIDYFKDMGFDLSEINNYTNKVEYGMLN